MNCPVCKNAVMQNEELAENLTAKACSACGGRWVPSFQYWKWRERLGKAGAQISNKAGESTAKDSSAGKLCPECGHFLTQRPVGHGVEFKLDRCTNCGGMWFDKNEWEVLASKDLQDKIHFIFSDAWQMQVRHGAEQQTHEKRIEKIIGEADYARLKEVMGWIKQHRNRETIVGYIEEQLK